MNVQILFPSSPAKSPEVYHTALEAARQSFAEWDIIEPPVLHWYHKEEPFGYLAGTDEERAGQLADFLKDPDMSVAWFARGGYGLTRTLRALDQVTRDLTLPSPKRLLGYSDITALFCWCRTRKLNVELVHSPMLCAFCKQPNAADVGNAVRGTPCPIPLSTPSGTEFQGSLWGGNLAVLASLCGTPWFAKPGPGQAAFLEDVGEAPYRVDRYLTQLHDSGFFQHTRRVYLGTYTEHEPAWQVLELARKRCGELGLEVLGELFAGHSEPHYPIFLDREYRYCSEKNCLLPVTQG